MKEESGGKKVDQFWEIYMWERTLYLILSFILSQWRDLRIGVMIVMKFRSFGDSTSSRVKDKLKTIRLCSR